MTQISKPSPLAPRGEKKQTQEGASLILIVTRNGRVSHAAMKYSLNIAERLGASLLVAYVNTLPFLWDGGRRDRFLEKIVHENLTAFRDQAQQRNIDLASVREYGKIGKVIRRLCHIVKRIDMVVVDKGVNHGEAASSSPVPVYCMQTGGEAPVQKLQYPPTSSGASRRLCARAPVCRPMQSALLSGLGLTALYIFFFAHIDTIMVESVKGGGFALVPVVTTCVFFWVENAFIQSVIAGVKERRSLTAVSSPLCSSSPGPYRRQAQRTQR